MNKQLANIGFIDKKSMQEKKGEMSYKNNKKKFKCQN